MRLDPILPGVTDSAESVRHLCRAIAMSGVRRIALGVLFLRPAVLHSLNQHLGGSPLQRTLASHFGRAVRLCIHAERSSVMALHRDARRLIYARVSEIAQECGLEVAVCGCKNPDLGAGSCNIAGEWPSAGSLFE